MIKIKYEMISTIYLNIISTMMSIFIINNCDNGFCYNDDNPLNKYFLFIFIFNIFTIFCKIYLYLIYENNREYFFINKHNLIYTKQGVLLYKKNIDKYLLQDKYIYLLIFLLHLLNSIFSGIYIFIINNDFKVIITWIFYLIYPLNFYLNRIQLSFKNFNDKIIRTYKYKILPSFDYINDYNTIKPENYISQTNLQLNFNNLPLPFPNNISTPSNIYIDIPQQLNENLDNIIKEYLLHLPFENQMALIEKLDFSNENFIKPFTNDYNEHNIDNQQIINLIHIIKTKDDIINHILNKTMLITDKGIIAKV